MGWGHSCALRATGTVNCWGDNYYGQLGIETTTPSSTVPVEVTEISSAVAVAAGGAHNCALLATGAVRCWGQNDYGQLGNSTSKSSSTPVDVVGINNARAIAAGAFFSCALLTDGGIKCWGHGGNAELGDGSMWPYQDSSVPVSVQGIDNAIGITAGAFHACALLSNGSPNVGGTTPMVSSAMAR